MALPNLPTPGQNPWYIPRTNWDNAVEVELEGRLSEPSVASNIRGVFGRTLDTDYASLALALAATPTSGTLEVRGQYTQSTPFVINKAVTLDFVGTSKITNTATAQDVIQITSSNVTLNNPRIVGAGMSVFGIGRGIRAFGSVSTPLSNIQIINPDIQEISHTAIELRLCGNSAVTSGNIRNCGYSAVTLLSATNSSVTGVVITDITQPAGYVNSYGIAITNYDASEPPSSDVLVSGNFVTNVPWEGLDSHGGLRVTFDRNSVINCGSSVSIVGGPGNIAAKDCVVSYNKCYTATRASAIIFVGPGSGTDRATGTVVGNEVVNATADSTNNAGIQAYNTKGLSIADNIVRECAVNGINAQMNNDQIVITGNTMTDIWSATVLTSAIFVGATANTSIVSNNTIVRGTKVAARVNEHGLRTGSSSPVQSVALGVNDFALATTPILDSSEATFNFGGARRQLVGISGGKVGFFGTAPIAKPASPGTAAGTDAAVINAISTALRNLGLFS